MSIRWKLQLGFFGDHDHHHLQSPAATHELSKMIEIARADQVPGGAGADDG